MAVRAEQLEVLEPVVVAIAIHVVQLERDRETAPCGESAFLASLSLDSGRDQPKLDVVPAPPAPARQQNVKGHRVWTRDDLPALYRLVPRCLGEAELLLALADRVSRVVVALNFGPVVAA